MINAKTLVINAGTKAVSGLINIKINNISPPKMIEYLAPEVVEVFQKNPPIIDGTKINKVKSEFTLKATRLGINIAIIRLTEPQISVEILPALSNWLSLELGLNLTLKKSFVNVAEATIIVVFIVEIKIARKPAIPKPRIPIGRYSFIRRKSAWSRFIKSGCKVRIDIPKKVLITYAPIIIIAENASANLALLPEVDAYIRCQISIVTKTLHAPKINPAIKKDTPPYWNGLKNVCGNVNNASIPPNLVNVIGNNIRN